MKTLKAKATGRIVSWLKFKEGLLVNQSRPVPILLLLIIRSLKAKNHKHLSFAHLFSTLLLEKNVFHNYGYMTASINYNKLENLL